MITYMYENGSLFRKEQFETISLHIPPRTGVQFGTFKEECINRARELYNLYPDMYVALSGGLESQVCLRSFIDAGLKPRVLVMKFSHQRNEYDVNVAIDTCVNYGISPLVIEIYPDITLKNAGRRLTKQYQLYTLFDIFVASVAETIKSPLLLVDSIDIRRDMNPEKTWCLIQHEQELWTQRFNDDHEQNGIIIDNFFRTNKQILSFLNLQCVTNLVNGRLPGKISIASSKKHAYIQAGFTGLENLKPTDHTYYLKEQRDMVTDQVFRNSLFEVRKLFVPLDEYVNNGDNTTWRHI